MGRVEKTVFISYRRTNMPWALAIYQNLTAHGYDVFFDYETIASGDFEQIILGNIRARAHFLVILTPSALERCSEPGDWLRREIETALDEKRNIVPVFLESFDFGSPSIAKYLTGKLVTLKKYNGQNVPAGFFDEAMDKLRNKFLNVSLDAVLHPVSNTVQQEVLKQQVAASNAADVSEKELTAQEWFEKGYKSNNPEEKIHCYTEAIRIKPDFADAYNNRGIVFLEMGKPVDAIKDANEAIRIRPDYAESYCARGIAYKDQNKLDQALLDIKHAIHLKPDLIEAHHTLGVIYFLKGDYDAAITHHTKTILLSPIFALAYWGRGNAWLQQGEYYSAAADYQRYFDLGGTDDTVRQYLKSAKEKIGK